MVNDPHVEIILRVLEPRLYVWSGDVSSVGTLKSHIINSASKSGIYLNANYRSKGMNIEFYCRDGIDSKRGVCSLKFHIRCDNKKNEWYLKVGSGCRHHSSHRPTVESSPSAPNQVQIKDDEMERSNTKNAERKRKKRRKEKEDMRNTALERFGLTSSDFQGDASTHQIAAAAAVAASAAPSSDDPFLSSGQCYLIPPVIDYNPNDIMVSCSCKTHASKHFWVGPKPDGMDELIAQLCASCGFNEKIDKRSGGGDDEDTLPQVDAKPFTTPTEVGTNGQVKRVDKDISEEFNSDKPFYAIKISKPTKAKKAETRRHRKYQFLSISGFPANTNPVASCSRLKISQNAELVLQNDIVEAGKELFASRWVEEAETRRKGSSSKYYTLLLHDHNAEGGLLKSGLSSIYFRPLENTKYWWLSYLTTREGTATERKGYGRMMMWRLINLARHAEGVEEIWLEVRPDLKGARKLYKSLGFEEVCWNDLPKEIEDYVMISPDLVNPQAKVKNRVYQHPNEFVLMRLKLSIFLLEK